MGFSVFNGSISAQEVNLSGGAQIAPNPNVKTVGASRMSNGTQTIYTVPVGKKAYLMYANQNSTSTSGSQIQILANGYDVSIREKIYQPVYPLILTAGQTVTMTVTGWTSGTMTAVITYLEEDA